MIIVKTTDGDKFVNDKAITALSHEREHKRVKFFDKEGNRITFDNVESVIYTNDAQPTQWADEGSEVQRLKESIKKKEKVGDELFAGYNYMRKCYMACQEALDDIEQKWKEMESDGEKYGITIAHFPIELCERAKKICDDASERYNRIIEEIKKK